MAWRETRVRHTPRQLESGQGRDGELRKFKDDAYAKIALSFYPIRATSSEFGQQTLPPQSLCPC